jgi:hypothetical protein
MCESPHKAVATRFSARWSEVLNKVIHRAASQVQFFSRIQNLAAKLKFYFNFDGITFCPPLFATRPCYAATQLPRRVA